MASRKAILNYRNFLFEFEDLDWFPNIIRESMTDYLRYLITRLDFYRPIIPLIMEGMNHSGAENIVDLCSGGGGAIEQIQQELHDQSGVNVNITLTDKFPNTKAYEFIAARTNGAISYLSDSIDVRDVPGSLTGFRTIFSGFHHFKKKDAKAIIQNAVSTNSGIGIFDGGDKSFLAILAILFVHPLLFFFFTPLFRPFRFSRLFFTYILPVIPFCTVWDGIISIIRLYRPKELLQFANEIESEKYYWKTGRLKCRYGLHVTFLIGYPDSQDLS
ncbi:MAG: class I SAM-dependent methyltransferase [Bacteroidetes bacterium]|nr:class I SAM-dependent methyltransferase [Bacteroidota bacterium]